MEIFRGSSRGTEIRIRTSGGLSGSKNFRLSSALPVQHRWVSPLLCLTVTSVVMLVIILMTEQQEDDQHGRTWNSVPAISAGLLRQ